MNIINLTPHPIVLRAPDGTDTVVPPSAAVARVQATPGALETLPGLPVPIARPDTFGAVEGLPDPAPDTVFIVSAMVGGRIGRPDVFTPGTGPADSPVRNDKGQIVAVTRLKATA
jgi:hypothetical protein